MEHTKECEYRNSHDMIHSNCFCKCHKILMIRRADQRFARRGRTCPGQPAHQHGRLRLVGLAHQQRCRGGDLVGEAGLRHAQRAAVEVGLSAQIDERGQAGDAERDADGAAPPGAAPAVADDHGERAAEVCAETVAQRGRRGIRVFAAAAARARRPRPDRCWSDRRRHSP